MCGGITAANPWRNRVRGDCADAIQERNNMQVSQPLRHVRGVVIASVRNKHGNIHMQCVVGALFQCESEGGLR